MISWSNILVRINAVRNARMTTFQHSACYNIYYYFNCKNSYNVDKSPMLMFGEKTLLTDGWWKVTSTMKKLVWSKEGLEFVGEEFKNYFLARCNVRDYH
jgi:hypothetical protein